MRKTQNHRMFAPQNETIHKIFEAVTCVVDDREQVGVLYSDDPGAAVMRLMDFGS